MQSPRDAVGSANLSQSPFSRFLNTNSVPTDAECEAIRQFLSGLQKNFAAFSGEIGRMQAAISDLASQCRRLRENIDAHQALVSLARRLPEDVIREIFLACLPSTGNAVMSSREAPLLLGQVCGSWRKIAFSTPQLWSSLHVVVPNLSKLRLITGAVGAWLTRSGVLPLSITLAVSAACEPGSDNVATMLDVLTHFSRRWKHVKITLSPRTILTPLTNLRVSDVPMLENVAFTSIGSGTWQNLVAPLEIPWRAFNFLRAPTIRGASFASLGGNMLSLPLPWARLSSLSLTAGNIKDSTSYHLTTSAALLILRQCPNLTSCSICISPDRSDDPDIQNQTSFTIPGLTDLAVDNREHSQANAVALFMCLLAPSLKRFQYHGPKYEGRLPFASLFSAINALESLTMDIAGLMADAFLHCVELVPSLTHLRLESGGAYDPWSAPGAWGREDPPVTPNDLLRLLTPVSAAAECAAPFLRRVELVRCAPLADDVVLNFITLRGEADRALTHVDVVFARQREFDIRPHLQDLVADGLHVALEYLPAPQVASYSPWEGFEQSAY
ncbi:hypothetical protein B0H10DRAFT_1159875 [Mycena sp. CBHHK59/15]|nr:hypothetical protein B0H10DRAFT_1159875 [Mycena sp. CBHHK59/15]